MAEKLLTETAWKTFAKGKDLGDDALLKALAKFGKINDDKHDDVLGGLTELEGAINKQVVANAKRKEKDVKEVKDQLHDMLSAVERMRKQVNAAKDAKAESEEEDSPAQLTSKMAPLVRLLRAGEEQLNAVIGVAKGEAAVLISRKSIGASQKKMVAAELGGSGVIYAVGTCFFEDKTLVFAVDKTPGQLAKRVHEALMRQVDQKIKIKIRAQEGGEEQGGEDGGDASGVDPAQGGSKPPPDQAKMAFAQLLVKLRVGVDRAAGKNHPLTARMQALMASASAKVQAGDTAAGMAELGELQKLVDESATDPGQSTTTEGGVDPGAAFNARLKALLPNIQNATQAGGENAAAVKLKFGQMGVLAKKPDYPGAHTVLDEIEALLEGQAGGSRPEGSTSGSDADGDPKQAEVDRLLASLQDDFEALQRGPLSPALRQQFQPLMTGWMAAQESITGKQLDRALLILRRMAETGTLAKLRQAMTERPSGPGGEGEDTGRLVRQRTFMLERWSKIPAQLRGLLAPLRKEISDADENADELVDEIESALEELLDEMQDELDDAINAGSTAGLKGARARFDRNELVQHLRTGPGVDSGKLLKAVLDVVDEIETEMTR
jgi:hypothetical protein